MSNNLYIRQEPLITGPVEVSTDNTNWSTISWPYTVTNPTPPTILKVLFTTDITLTANDQFFVCGSEYIQFGSESLNPDGTRPTITISGANDYPGLINNGDDFPIVCYGKNNISVYNLTVDSLGATLSNFGGWIGQPYFSYYANNNYIIGCSSKGYITSSSGGIAGTESGIAGNLNIIGCDSSGDIDNNGGGILASGSGYGALGIYQCFSTGKILGEFAGGIVGYSTPSIIVSNCYSIGDIIGNEAGGILGKTARTNQVSNSYSKGIIIGPNAGGIVGSNSYYCTVTNCYSSGNITGINATGIFGPNGTDPTETNCYAANGSWSDSVAASNLQNIGWGSGNIWGSLSSDTPYVLVGFGASPYTLNNIDPTTQTLVQTFSQSVQAGDSTPGVQAIGYKTFAIQAGGDPTITINNTGVITTTTTTAGGVYTLSIYAVDDYTTTTYFLTVIAQPTPPTPAGGAGVETTIPPCCQPICPQFNQTTNNTQTEVSIKHEARAIANNVDATYVAINEGKKTNVVQPVFNSYRDYMLYLQSKYR